MFENFPAELSVLGAIFTADALRYLIPATLAYLVLWVALRGWSEQRRLGPGAPEARQMLREFALSMSTVVVFALNGYGIYLLARAGVFVIYGDVAEYGWTWWWASLALLIVGHDLYFYAVHRLLHRPWWFRHVHRAHHASVHPSPWAAYAFHPIEAVLMAAYLPLALAVMPLHPGVIFLFLVHMIVRNVLGHCGVALTARNALGRWYGRWFITTLHHHLHHSAGGGNFGLYFRHLDRWFGTEQRGYHARLEAQLS
jgi:sterol desaturase/sphingolipid hydroxylase (fatty acid hydroxylase superfamily)